MENKRILQVIDSMGFGGAEKVVMTLSEGFVQAGCSVDVILIDDIELFVLDDKINFHKLGFKKSWKDYRHYTKKLHIMIENIENNFGRFDLVLVHLQKSIRLMRTFRHEKIFFILHSNLSNSSLSGRSGLRYWLKKKRLQDIYNGLNLIAVSNGVQSDAVEKIEILPKSIRTIYNPVNLQKITELSMDVMSIIENDYIVHVGSFSKVKRHDVLLQAFSQLQFDGKLVLVGDGPEKENIKKLIQELDLGEKVILSGFQQNPYPFIKNSKLLVLSSAYEGLPTVLLEALSLNVPVISTDCQSGPKEILIDELSKYLVKTNDVESLSYMIDKVIKESYEIPEHIIKRFALDKITKLYLDLVI